MSCCFVEWEVCAVITGNSLCFDAAAKQVVWLPSGCPLASIHGHLKGRSFLLFLAFRAEHALMECDVWTIVFCCSFNRLSIGAMRSMKCHVGEAFRFLSV